ncbi:MAG: lysine--tRNA ligase [Candidatus Lokiarchaeota archaeon]|nr:lysine--tRNA ligase [Candidatus Lokiarchaeota archaeon]
MSEKSEKKPEHWVDKLTSKIIENWPEVKSFNCNCGLSISGFCHVGNLRGEIIHANAVVNELQSQGYEATHNLILYTADPWKGKETQLNLYPNPKKAEKYKNWRLIEVPSPSNPNISWVDYYWKDFGDPLPRFARDIEIIRTHELYQQEKMKKVVIELINKRDQIRKIINKYRKENPFPEDWIPINPFCESCNRIGTSKALEVNLETYQVHYSCNECKHDGWSDISKGKLTWRLEWLAIWYVLNIHFEPYGKDHATPGGSRDSCIEIIETVLHHKSPYGFWNEWVGYSEGRTDYGDMTGSGFIGFTPANWIEFAEPEVLKYLYLKTPPRRRIILGLDKVPSYISEYDRAQRIYYGIEKFEDPTELHSIKRSYEIVFYNNPPKYRGFQLDYQHAIILSQLTTPDQEGISQAIQKLIDTEILNEKPSKEITDHIQLRLMHGRNWINSKYAPDHLRIRLEEHFSKDILKEYDIKIRNLMGDLAETLEKTKWTEEGIKKEMMALKEKEGLSRKEMTKFFQILYQTFLGNTRGPRFAPFLATLDKDWVINRLHDAGNCN